MVTKNVSFQEAFREVKKRRSVASPNVGFLCTLMELERFMTGAGTTQPVPAVVGGDVGGGVGQCYAMLPHAVHDTGVYVPKCAMCRLASSRVVMGIHAGLLDDRCVCVVFGRGKVFVWEGEKCNEEMKVAGRRFAGAAVEFFWGREAEIVKVEGRDDPRWEGIVAADTGEKALYEESFDWIGGTSERLEYTTVSVASGGEVVTTIATGDTTAAVTVLTTAALCDAMRAPCAPTEAPFAPATAPATAPLDLSASKDVNSLTLTFAEGDLNGTSTVSASEMSSESLTLAMLPNSLNESESNDFEDVGEVAMDGSVEGGAPSHGVKLFELNNGKWEQLKVYDDLELVDEAFFALVCCDQVYLWAGEAFVATCGGVEKATALAQAAKFADCGGELPLYLLGKGVCVVEQQGSESSEFWDMFESGY